MPSVRLDDRGVLEVAGPEARAFLDRIITCDVEGLAPESARYGALLSPQGKILTDFILLQAADGPAGERFVLDVPAHAVAELLKRLTLYRLRAKLTIADRSADLAVVAGWGETAAPSGAEVSAQDPRLPELGWRAVIPRATAAGMPAEAGAYHAHRIGLGIPAGGQDFAFGDAFPHEAIMDQLHGVDFKKGCYVGQEVVSRMQHRGTARTRLVPVVYDGPAPAAGQEVRAGERAVGRTGTSSGSRGLAMLRLDRVSDALESGEPLTAEAVSFRIDAPGWLSFAVPGRKTDAA